MFLIFNSLNVFSTGGDAQYGTNFSISNGYIAFARFNQSDSTTIEPMATGQTWTAQQGISNVNNGILVMDETTGGIPDQMCFAQNFTKEYSSDYTCDTTFRVTTNDMSAMIQWWTGTDCTGAGPQMTVGLQDRDDVNFDQILAVYDDVSSPIAKGTPNIDAKLLGDTTILARIHVNNSGEGVNGTWFNFSVTNGVITTTQISTTGWIKVDTGIKDTRSLAIRFDETTAGVGNYNTTQFDCYNGTIRPAFVSATPSIVNNTPILKINTPLNNSQTHNATPFINISITAGTFNNMSFAVFLDTNSNPTTMINSSNLTASVNFTISSYTITQSIGGSINGTYYLKINATDNQSNVVSTIINFNLTNDINQYNITNTSITPMALSVNTQAKCHSNITNKASTSSMPNQTDNISISDLRWFINGSEVLTAGNNSLLNAQNTTLNSNISCMQRKNNGFGDTAWTMYVSTQNITVGDITSPAINSFAISSTSPLTTDIVNITANITDNTILTLINFPKVTIDAINYTMILIGDNIFQYAAAWALGQHNISYFIAQDTSSNTQTNTSTINFNVTSPPSSSGTSSSGGSGGGSLEPTIVLVSQELICSSAGTNYTISNIQGSTLGYSLVTDYKNTKKKCRDILIRNNGVENITINLECTDTGNFTSGFCRYINLSETQVELKPNVFQTKTVKMCVLPLDEKIEGDFFYFAIKTSDEKGICTSQLSNQVETGGFNGFLAKFVSFRRLGKLNYPFILPALSFGFVIGFLFNLIFRLVRLPVLGILSAFLTGIGFFIGYLLIF